MTHIPNHIHARFGDSASVVTANADVPAKQAAQTAVRQGILELAATIENRVINGRNKSLALTAPEEVQMRVNREIWLGAGPRTHIDFSVDEPIGDTSKHYEQWATEATPESDIFDAHAREQSAGVPEEFPAKHGGRYTYSPRREGKNTVLSNVAGSVIEPPPFKFADELAILEHVKNRLGITVSEANDFIRQWDYQDKDKETAREPEVEERNIVKMDGRDFTEMLAEERERAHSAGYKNGIADLEMKEEAARTDGYKRGREDAQEATQAFDRNAIHSANIVGAAEATDRFRSLLTEKAAELADWDASQRIPVETILENINAMIAKLS